jgi:AcrR family transcriptional regulator
MPRKGLTHSNVVEEAAALADEVGLDQVSFAALAKRLGVSAPSLYKHVDGLAQLHRDLTILGLTELWTRVSAAAVGKSKRDALVAVAVSYREFARERPGLVSTVLRAPAAGDEEHEAAAIAALTVIRQILAGYHLSEDDTIHAIRALRVITHGFTSLENAGGFGMSQSLDETYLRLVDALDQSLSTRR